MIVDPTGKPMTSAKPAGPTLVTDPETKEDWLMPSVATHAMSTRLIEIITDKVADKVVDKMRETIDDLVRKVGDGT